MEKHDRRLAKMGTRRKSIPLMPIKMEKTRLDEKTNLTQAATSALKNSWGMLSSDYTLEYLGKSKFCVKAEKGNQYALTTFAPTQKQWPGSVEAIEALMIWLEDLSKEMDFPTPRPINTQDGNLIGTGQDAKGMTNHVSLLQWVPGKLLWDEKTDPLPESLPSTHLSDIGRILARLHEHALKWNNKSQNNRASVNRLGFDIIQSKIHIAVERGHFTKEEGEILAQAAKATESHLCSLEASKSENGLLHGDFHVGNCAVKDNKIGIFDFEACCRGPFLFDIAKTLKFLVSSQMRKTVVESYRVHRSLPESALKTIEAHLIQSRLNSLTQRADRSYMPPFVLDVTTEAEAFLEDKRFIL